MSEDDHFDPMESIFVAIQLYEQQKKINLVDHEHFLRYYNIYKCRCNVMLILKKKLAVGVQLKYIINTVPT